MRPGVAWAIALAALLAGGAARAAERSGPIVLIVIDTLRADHLSCYGYPRPTSPEMCSLARDGALFVRAFTSRTETTPAIASMLTGLHPHRHGVQTLYLVLPEDMTTLAERLGGAGYRTGGFVSSFVMVRNFSGFDQGFEVYDDEVRTKEPFRENYERPARETVDRALAWLDGAGPRAFLFLHLIDPHGPYTPPQELVEKFALPDDGRELPADVRPYQRIPGVDHVSQYVGRYDGEIAHVDPQVGRVFSRLRERGWYDAATIALVSDHGESMGEAGQWFHHGNSLHRAEARVPLVIKWPRDAEAFPGAGARVTRAVSVGDLFPTLLAAAGLEGAPAPATDLRAALSGEPASGSPVSTYLPAEEGMMVAVRNETCGAVWLLPWQRFGEKDPGAAAERRAWLAQAAEGVGNASPACVARVVPEALPLLEDLLDYRLATPVVSRLDVLRPGQRSRFIEQREGEVVPLSEQEKEALRRLGYLE